MHRKTLNKSYRNIFEKKQFTLLKYLLPLLLVLFVSLSSKTLLIFLVGLFELSIIVLFSNELLKRNFKKTGYILNSLLLLIFNIQFFVKYFSGTFVTLIMLSNVESLNGLSGKFPIYIGGSLLVVVMSLLPIRYINFKKSNRSLLALFLSLELAVTMLYGNTYSQIFGVYNILLQYKDNIELKAAIKAQGDVAKEFYKVGVSSGRDDTPNLPKKPNVVVVFTEGLSQHIIEDKRNIMPNAKELQSKSITFLNYYNHTFATYRGLSGQLYSGYQFDNYDKNNLVSIQSILKKNNYHTSFINTEPKNSQFTSYLENFEFDEVLTNIKNTKGEANSLSDEQAYQKLFKVMKKQNKDGKPFFTAMYTYGTHQSFDSVDQKFENGKDKVLNRFYNVDHYLGKFIKEFDNSELSKNTIVVFTADHGTFADAEYKNAFPDQVRVNPDVDTIPLSIYYKGMIPVNIDVQGRNSLSFAPTLLDYIGISEENYFLGESLFLGKENNNSYDTVFHDNTYKMSTDLGQVKPLSESQEKIIDNQLQKYFAAKQQIVEK